MKVTINTAWLDSLDPAIKDAAKDLLQAVHRGSNPNKAPLHLAAIYISAKKQGNPILPEAIARENGGITAKDILKYATKIKRELSQNGQGCKLKALSAAEHFQALKEKLFVDLRIPPSKREEFCHQVIALLTAYDNSANKAKAPRTKIGAATYIALILINEHRSQREIAISLSLQEAGIYNTYKTMATAANVDISF